MRIPRRLGLVTDARTFGGAERYLVELACAARTRGIEPHVLWLVESACDENLQAAMRDAGVSWTTVRHARSAPSLVRGFHRALMSFRPEALVINAAGRPRFWLTCWAARRAGIPALWVHHMVEQADARRLPPRHLGGTMEGPQWWRVPQALRHRLAAAGARAIVTSSEGDRDRVARQQGIARSRIAAVPPGINPARLQFQAVVREDLHRLWGVADACPEPLVVGTAARLVPGKGIETLLEALGMLCRSGLRIVGVVAGEGPGRDALMSQAQRLGIAEHVRFIGFVEQMRHFYCGLDIFALLSETESFGLVLAEAMACERAVIATPTAGGRQQVQHLQNGWLLKSYSAQELAESIVRLHADRPLRESLGVQGRASVCRRFSIDRTLDELLRLLQPSPVGGRAPAEALSSPV